MALRELARRPTAMTVVCLAVVLAGRVAPAREAVAPLVAGADGWQPDQTRHVEDFIDGADDRVVKTSSWLRLTIDDETGFTDDLNAVEYGMGDDQCVFGGP